MKRSVGIVVRSGIWVATAGLLLGTLLFVRLLIAPIDLGFARDAVISQTKELLPGWLVSFEEAEVGWDWRRVRPWVSLQDVRFIDRRNRLTAFVPEARVALAFTDFFTNVSFSTVEIDRAQVLVSNLGGFSDASDEGTLNALYGESGVPTPEVFKPVSEAFSRFGARLLNNAPALDQVSFTNVLVGLVRTEGLENAEFAVPRLTVTRRLQTLALDAVIDARLAETPTQIRLQGTAEPFLGDMELSLSFSEFRPSSLSILTDLPEVVSYLNVPVALDVDVELSAARGLELARFSATLDEGELVHPVSFPGGSTIRYGLITGRYEAGENTLVFDGIEIATLSRVISGEGLFYWIADEQAPAVQLTARVKEVTIPEVLQYWPIAVHPDGTPRGARAWIDSHIISGRTHNVSFEVDWNPTTGGGFDGGSPYRLTFGFDNLDTYYLLSMPQIKRAAGQGVLTRDVFDLELTAGSIEDMPIAGTTIHMTDIDVRNGATGMFDLRLSGDVATIMDVIDHEPLRVPQKMGFDVSRVNGDAHVRAVISLPLIKDLPADDVTYEVNASIMNTTVADLLGGEGLTEGDLTLLVDKDSVAAEGAGRMNGIPLALYWREDLVAGRDDPAATTTEIVLSGAVDENDIMALGVDVSPYLSGRVLAEATFIGRNFSFSRGYFSADTTGAILKERHLSWRKEASSPATVTGTVIFDDDRTSLSPLIVNGENMDVRADIWWGAEGTGQFTADVDVTQLGENSFRASITEGEDGSTTIDIAGKQFDLGPILDAEQEGKAQGIEGDIERLNLALSVDTLLLMNGEKQDAVTLNGSFLGGAPERLEINALVHGTSKALSLNITPSENQALRDLRVTTPDAGHFLRGLGLFSHLRDGELELSGKTSGWGNDLHIQGTINIRDSYMVSKNKLSDQVSEGVIEGLNEYLKDDAVELGTIEMPFDYSQGVLDISKMKANGPSLGMTMEGQISARAEKINVNGVFVPAYGLNALLGKIPLLGAILTGGEGKGIFGVAYRVKGPTANPEFSVNPLSGLAPGFLRLLFEGRKGKVDDVEGPDVPKVEEPAGEGVEPKIENPEPQPGVLE
ncbi:AsmA-like C-terminal domain-containing protein [Kordiimonas sp.]|uniref:YhdP family protein n=1 Tax=Kordiimonas sp. TaxID=1970157 RepID=UPI003A8D8371